MERNAEIKPVPDDVLKLFYEVTELNMKAHHPAHLQGRVLVLANLIRADEAEAVKRMQVLLVELKALPDTAQPMPVYGAVSR